MGRYTERFFVLTLLGAFLIFTALCSCEKENLIDPPDFFESADSYDAGSPDFWPVCPYSCGDLVPSPEAQAAPPPGGDIYICTGPNPTSGPFCVEYTLRAEADVAMSVYSQKGEKINSLVRENQLPLTYSRTWDLTDEDGRQVPNGTYRVFFKAGDYVTHGDVIVRR
ncbi:MAG: hypothetical protein JSW03_05105 [Candidatus Eiseniibacteriota bacterium]|nr:MAG: hypothetical protein JSW03_05105 [Candidatus Eisenbacteria bacterium]